MQHHSSLTDAVLTRNVKSPINASGTVVNSTGIDMQPAGGGYDGARFVINVGVLGTNGTVDANVIASANSNMSGAVAINGSALTQVTNANTVHIIDIFRPTLRYLALAATGHTNGALISATVDLYRKQGTLPPTQSAEQVKRVVQN